VYLEHKELWTTRGEVDAERAPMRLGKAEVVMKGEQITFVTWSKMRHICVEAGRRIGAEVIDLKTLWPWDRETVLESVRRTGRLLVVHEAVRAGGFGAEVAAEVSEALWRELKGPVRRLGGPRSPVPYAEPLENLFRIGADQVAKTAMEMTST
jgi:pyruvate dehydrogenase E1 component beta subunit